MPLRDAVILAAGRGTRLGALTEKTPKPMLEIDGRPLLEHVLEALEEAGLDRFAIVTGHLAEQIETHFGDGSSRGVSIRYCRQERRDGTARALLLAREAVGENPFLLVWGDILIPRANYRAIRNAFETTQPDVVLAVHWVQDPSRGGAVTTDGSGRIVSIVEKPEPGTMDTHWINAGIGAFRPGAFDYVERVPLSPRGEYEIPDALTAMIRDGLDLRTHEIEGPWIDVGTPEDLTQARSSWRDGGNDPRNTL